MKLFLVQHAEARTRDEDPGRTISDAGRNETERMASFVSQRGCVTAVLIGHSGKRRAEQTAGIFADKLGIVEQIEKYPDLAPKDDVAIWAKKLDEMSKDIMLVGHMPHLEYLASFLLTGNQSGIQIDFRNSGIVCLERDDEKRWLLSWILTPSLIP